jgi:inner membrane protein
MDNLCHSLVGLAMAEAGLKHRTRYATAALVIGANFPDIDVVAVPLGHSIAWRRGHTHGVLALVVLPFVLAGLILAWDRWRRRGGRDIGRMPDPRQLVLLSGLAILTHPTLDFMNTYGVRWLMPFADRWYYGDALFIIDVWLWMALVVGVVWSRRLARRGRQHAARPARVALLASAAYIVVMIVAAAFTRARVERTLPERLGASPNRVMVAPVAVNPFRRDVVFQLGMQYGFASTTALPGARLVVDDASIPIGGDDPDAARARLDPRVPPFLHWARFPFYVVARSAAGTRVDIVDARYGRDPGTTWASVRVMLPARLSPNSEFAPLPVEITCASSQRSRC